MKNLELLDYTKDDTFGRSVVIAKEVFGEDCEIYAVGFSLGSNHLLRHLGSHSNCHETCGIKAAVSISGAFDLPSTIVDIR